MAFSTYRGSFMPEDTFALILRVVVQDSDDWPEYKNERDETFEQITTVRLADIPTEDALARRMVFLYREYLDATWEHEAREFLRVKDGPDGEYCAVFHPHHHGDEPDKGYNNGDSRFVLAGKRIPAGV